jgi:GAF domain-containing protein
MFTSFSRHLHSRHSNVPAAQSGAAVLNTVLLALIVAGPVAAALRLVTARVEPLQDPIVPAGIAVASFAFVFRWLLGQGYVTLASWLTVLLLFVTATLGVAATGGVRSGLIAAYALIVFLSSLILPAARGAVAVAVLAVTAVATLYVLEVTGVLAFGAGMPGLMDVVLPAVLLAASGWLAVRVMGALQATAERVRASEAEVVRARDELGTLKEELEARVVARTRALALSSEVSRRLSTILDRRQLVDEIVNQLRQAFDYYHVHVYLLGETGTEMVLAGGTGEVGAIMLERGHKLSLDQGLVGRAATTRLPVLAAAVHEEPAWFPNPLLPQTKAEVAVPIILGEELLGVLDVQHDAEGGLGAEDVDLLTSIANQAAVGLQNARLYEAAQREADRQVLLNTITQRIQSTTSVEEALQVAVREIGRVVPGQAAAVRLQPERRGAKQAPARAQSGNGEGRTDREG